MSSTAHADGPVARHALQALAAEHVGDPAHGLLDVERVAVRGGDARRLLASMLERVQAEVGDVGGLLVIPDAESPHSSWNLSSRSSAAGSADILRKSAPPGLGPLLERQVDRGGATRSDDQAITTHLPNPSPRSTGFRHQPLE
jgi:hypothetical protein